MSFWTTFKKVWEVRTSIRIQESLENSIREIHKTNEIRNNLPEIINEIVEVNSSWEAELERRRKEK
jgi:hypothetical protein